MISINIKKTKTLKIIQLTVFCPSLKLGSSGWQNVIKPHYIFNNQKVTFY